MEIKFFPIQKRTRCDWCMNLTRIAVLDTEKNPAPICTTHYEFFVEPLSYWAWKNRPEAACVRRLEYTK